MVAYARRMPVGIVGAVSRVGVSKMEPVHLKDRTPVGTPLQLDSNGSAVPLADVSKIHGWLTRPYPTQSEVNDFGMSTLPGGTVQDSMRSGYMTVRISAAEVTKPVAGMPVKIVLTATGAYLKGDLAISQGTVIPGCTFNGEADGDGNVEIAFNI